MAAPILGGLLVEPIGWRGILGVVAAFTGVLVLMVAFWVPSPCLLRIAVTAV